MRNRHFFAFVILPTILTAAYYGLAASKQYESSADFVVRRADGQGSAKDIGQLLGFSFGGGGGSGSDAYILQEYLLSHDAVEKLRRENSLVAVFRREGSDPVSRLWSANPSPERLLKFYRNQVNVQQDDISGISHLTVHSFRPEDSHALAEKLLQMGDDQVNTINQRTYDDQVRNAQREYNEANRKLADIQTQITEYRRWHADIDPTSTGRAAISMVTGLTANLVSAQARFQAMEGVISHSSPQYQAMARQVRTLQAQVGAQSSKIAGPDQSVANRLGDYEQLVIKREEIAKVYEIAAAQLEQAQAEAKRKQLYLVRVVEPNMPVKSEYPERLKIIITVFAALFLLYAIGWLLITGVKEHDM